MIPFYTSINISRFEIYRSSCLLQNIYINYGTNEHFSIVNTSLNARRLIVFFFMVHKP